MASRVGIFATLPDLMASTIRGGLDEETSNPGAAVVGRGPSPTGRTCRDGDPPVVLELLHVRKEHRPLLHPSARVAEEAVAMDGGGSAPAPILHHHRSHHSSEQFSNAVRDGRFTIPFHWNPIRVPSRPSSDQTRTVFPGGEPVAPYRSRRTRVHACAAQGLAFDVRSRFRTHWDLLVGQVEGREGGRRDVEHAKGAVTQARAGERRWDTLVDTASANASPPNASERHSSRTCPCPPWRIISCRGPRDMRWGSHGWPLHSVWPWA